MQQVPGENWKVNVCGIRFHCVIFCGQLFSKVQLPVITFGFLFHRHLSGTAL